MKSVSLIDDVGRDMFALSLLYAVELHLTNVPVMIVWQLVGTPMFVVMLFVLLLIIPWTAAVAVGLPLPNTVEIIVTNIPGMFVEIPLEMLTFLTH